MRKSLIVLTVLLLIFIAACSNKVDENLDGKSEGNNVETNINGEEPIEVEDEHEEKDQENENNEDENNEDENIEAQYEIDGTWSIVPISDTANEQVVLLTIDDAPDRYALEMAETLAKLDAPAIFFVNGHFLEKEEEKEVLKKIHELGFVIGNHTYGHPNLSTLSEEEQKEEIIRVNDMVEEITGERPKFFRPPFGVYTDYTKSLLDEEGMVYMNWTYGYDWESDYMTEDAIKDIMVNAPELRNGGNLLMHDREWTAAALHDIVIGLRDKGYEMVDPLLIAD